jgi:hypothetical protein
MPSGIDNAAISTSVALSVQQATGRAVDAASAAGYASLVYSITGYGPQVLTNDDGSVTLVLSAEQVKKMQQWIDKQVLFALLPKARKSAVAADGKPSFDLGMGPVTGPVALKYALIFGGLFFTAGFMLRGIMR